ncbi:MAG: hypothetical protein IJ220_04480 [Clostridia bacterium]|nr:hypothetical protein [Clostridia bacterium]
MNEELDLLDLFFAFWKKKIWLIAAIIIGACVGFVYTKYAVVPKYTSSVTLILAKSSDEKANVAGLDVSDTITQSDIALNQKLISTYGEILTSKRVVNTVVKNLGLNISYAQLKKGISVSSVKDTDVIKLSITTTDASTSAKIADEMTNVFKDEVDRIYSIKNISIIDSAEVDNKPVNINYMKNIIIFALAFFVLVAIVIFLIYYFDNTIKTEENIQKLTGLPVLCTIPKVKTTIEKGGKKHA